MDFDILEREMFFRQFANRFTIAHFQGILFYFDYLSVYKISDNIKPGLRPALQAS